MAFRAGKGIIDLALGTRRLAGQVGGVKSIIGGLRVAAMATSAAFMAIGAIAVATATKSLRVFSDFEFMMARVKAISGATGDEFAALQKEAERLGRSTIFTARQVAEAMSYFALAGHDAHTIIKSMTPTLNLAAAGQLDMATAASITARVMGGMQLKADELEHAVDVLAKAFTTSETDLIQLGEALKYVGPIAKDAGYSFEETVAALQLLAKGGIQASMAGTGLRKIITTLKTPKVAKEFKALGIEVYGVGKNLRKLPEIIGKLHAAMEKMDPLKQAKIIAYFGERAGPQLSIMLGRGEDALMAFEKALVGAAGTAERIANIQMDTLTGSFAELKSAIEGIYIAEGDRLAPAFRELTTEIKEQDGALRKLIASFNDAALAAAQFATEHGEEIGAGATVAGRVVGTITAAAGGAAAGLLGATEDLGKIIANMRMSQMLTPEQALWYPGSGRKSIWGKQQDFNKQLLADAPQMVQNFIGARGLLDSSGSLVVPFAKAWKQVLGWKRYERERAEGPGVLALKAMRGRIIERTPAGVIRERMEARFAPAGGEAVGRGRFVELQEMWRSIQLAAVQKRSPEVAAIERVVQEQETTNEKLDAIAMNTGRPAIAVGA